MPSTSVGEELVVDEEADPRALLDLLNEDLFVGGAQEYVVELDTNQRTQNGHIRNDTRDAQRPIVLS